MLLLGYIDHVEAGGLPLGRMEFADGGVETMRGRWRARSQDAASRYGTGGDDVLKGGSGDDRLYAERRQ
ncbi:MAG: hypothetical protein ACYYK0_03630 [Candidatus Eutrophobiaceae bacterium]